MKFIFCCVFLFTQLLGFSQNIENSSFTSGSGYSVLSIEFEKENKVTFVSSHCLGSDIAIGNYTIKSDTIYCEYKPFLIDYTTDSILNQYSISDSIELSILFQSPIFEDSCTIHFFDTLSSYFYTKKFAMDKKVSLKIPRNLNQLIIEFVNKYNMQLEDFTNYYLSRKTQTNTFQFTVFNYSTTPLFREHQTYYFDQKDPNVIWLVNPSNQIKLKRK